MREGAGIAAALLLVGCFSSGGGDVPAAQDVPTAGDTAADADAAASAGDTRPSGAGAGVAGGEPVGGDSGSAGAPVAGVGGAGAGGVGGEPAPAGMDATGGVGGVAGIGVAGIGGPPPSCATANVRAAVRQPTLVVALSPAASMATAFGGSTRYQAAYDALLGPGGIAIRLEGRLRVGGVFLAGTDSCPSGVISPPSLALGDVIAASLGVPNGGFTVGDAALSAAYDLLDDTAVDPAVLWILDEVPLACGSMTDATVASTAEIAAAATRGVQTHIVSLSNAGPVLASVDALAAPTSAPPLVPLTGDELRDALDQIVGSLASCTFDLNGAVALGQECTGLVELNGDALECNGPDGWSMVDDHTLRLTGVACQDFKTVEASQVRVSFPCQAFVPD